MEMELNEKCRNGIPLPLPPRLEDAGLEDCALSPDGIREAFLKAAQAVKSTILPTEDEHALSLGKWPSNGEWTDSLQNYSPTPNNSGSCVGSLADGVVEEGTDKLVGIGVDNVEADQIFDGEKPEKHLGEDDGVCVADLKWVPGFRVEKDENGEEEREEGPILAETYV